MECFNQKMTRREALDNALTVLNEKLGLKNDKVVGERNMIHGDSAYGGTTLSGYVACSGDKNDYSGNCVTDIGLYYIGRMSDKKLTEIVWTMVRVIEYAEQIKRDN